jgi:hypothetical protein
MLQRAEGTETYILTCVEHVHLTFRTTKKPIVISHTEKRSLHSRHKAFAKDSSFHSSCSVRPTIYSAPGHVDSSV